MLAIIIIIAVLWVIMVTPVKFRIYGKYENNKFKVEHYLKYGFIKILDSNRKRKKPKTQKSAATKDKPQKEKPSPKSVIDFLWEMKAEVKKLIQSVLSYTTKRLIKITKLRIKGVVGLSDAHTTAIIYGISSGVLYNTIGTLDKSVRVTGIDIDYQPDFNEEQIFIEFESIINTKIFNILALARLVLLHGLPIIRKGGKLRNGKSN